MGIPQWIVTGYLLLALAHHVTVIAAKKAKAESDFAAVLHAFVGVAVYGGFVALLYWGGFYQ